MSWASQGENGCTMDLADDGAEWLKVRCSGAAPSWRVDSRLGGTHYKLPDAFPTMHAAQGAALLLAMRLVPSRRAALHAALDRVPDAWWWKIVPGDDPGAEDRSICSSRIAESEASAERSGRAAGVGWRLYVYGPGSVRVVGQLPR